jgi:hypothetical protein
MRSIYATGAPPMLRVAAVAQALEAAGLVVAAGFQVAEVASGHSYQRSSGIALAVLEVITAALLAWIASAIAQLRPWGRTPAVMTQVCVALLALILLQGQQYTWGVPALVLAIVGLAGLLHPASLRALRRPAPSEEASPPKSDSSKKAGPAKKAEPAKKSEPSKKPEPTRKAPAGSKRK